MRTRADIVVTSLTTDKFNRLVNGKCKFEEATGGVTLVSDTVLEFATPVHVVTAPGINNPRCVVTPTGGDPVGGVVPES